MNFLFDIIKIFFQGIHGCQINYNFLIDPNIRSEKLRSDQHDNRNLLFSKGMKPLENILNNERLKFSITHPVLSSFINLKSRKFGTIFSMNFYIFMFLFMVRKTRISFLNNS